MADRTRSSRRNSTGHNPTPTTPGDDPVTASEADRPCPPHQTPSANGQPQAGPATSSLADYAHSPEPPPAAVPNPATQLAAYLSSDQVGADTAPKPPPRVTALQVRKPSDQEFVRVKAGEQLVMPLFKLKNGGRLFLYKPCVEPYLDPRHYRDSASSWPCPCGR